MKSLTESILSSNKAGMKDVLINIILSNKSEENLKTLQRIWTRLGFDLPGGSWRMMLRGYLYSLESDSGLANIAATTSTPGSRLLWFNYAGAHRYKSVLDDLKITKSQYQDWENKIVTYLKSRASKCTYTGNHVEIKF